MWSMTDANPKWIDQNIVNKSADSTFSYSVYVIVSKIINTKMRPKLFTN